MNDKSIHNALETLTPKEETKAEMLEHILDSSSTPSITKQYKRHRFLKVASIAACIGLCSIVGVTAYANHFWGIQDLLLDSTLETTPTPVVSNEINETIDSDPLTSTQDTYDIAQDPYEPIVTQPPVYHMISMQGYADSVEYQASKEWYEFESNYDTDGTIIAQVGNTNNEYTLKYPLYYCYSKEMADMIDSIVNKYNLTMHQEIYDIFCPEDLYGFVGTGAFITSPWLPVYSGYVYDDGTFHFDSEIVYNNEPVIVQFDCAKKGVFSQVFLNIGDPLSYTQDTYVTKSGAAVTIALGDQKGLILYDSEQFFVVVNILYGTSNGYQLSQIKDVADLFDFTLIP